MAGEAVCGWTGAWPLASRFLTVYRRRLPVDPERLALREPVHLVHGWGQVLAAEAGLLGGPTTGTPGEASLRPALASWWQARLERRLALLR